MARNAALLVCFAVLFSVAASAPCYVIAGLSDSLDNFGGYAVGDGYGTQEFRNALSNIANFGPDGTSQASFEFRSLDEITLASLADVNLLILNGWAYCNEGIPVDVKVEPRSVSERSYPCDSTALDTILDAVSNGMDLWFVPYGPSDVNADYLGIPQSSGSGFSNYFAVGANLFQDGPFGDVQDLDLTFGLEWNVNSLSVLSDVQVLYGRSQNDGYGNAYAAAEKTQSLRSISNYASQFIYPSGSGRILVDGIFGSLNLVIVDPRSAPAAAAEKQERNFEESIYPPSSGASSVAKASLNAIDFFVRDFCPSADIQATFSDGSSCPSKIVDIDANASCDGVWTSSSPIIFDDATSPITKITITESGTYQLTWTSCNGFPVYKQITYLEPLVGLPKVLCETALSTGTKFTLSDILQVNCGDKIDRIVVSDLPPTTTVELTGDLTTTPIDVGIKRVPRPIYFVTLDTSTPGTFIISGIANQYVLENIVFVLDGSIKGSSLPSKKIFYSIDVYGTDLSILKSFPRLSLTLCAEGDLIRTLAWGCFCAHY